MPVEAAEESRLLVLLTVGGGSGKGRWKREDRS